jgi:formamidopyrimidine-DNA glycosylase
VPELPEVETIRRELAPSIAGHRIRAVRVRKDDILLAPPRGAAFRRRVEGRRILDVERRGKWLVLRLDEGRLVTQLRMTGRFAVGPGPRPPVEEFRHVAVELDLDDGRTLFYDDARRLGGMRWLSDDAWERESRRLGPEPLADGYRATHLAGALRRGPAPVKNALLDQRRLAGVGNIYASEALHRARIDPRRPGPDLDDAEVRALHRALRAVLREALAGEGSSVRNYRAVNGRSGRFQERLRVYDRAGEPCVRCGGVIARIVQAGRSTYFCPDCQA